VHQNTAVLKYTNSLKHKIYIYYARGMRLLPRLVERFVLCICLSCLSSCDSVCLNIFQCKFECLIFTCYPIVLFEDIGPWASLLSPTYAIGRYALNGWLQQLNKFQEHGDHGYGVHKHHSMSDVVLIVDPLNVL